MPYMMSFNENLKRYFEDHAMSYETFGLAYRIKNIMVYFYKCEIWPIRGRVKGFLPRIVRKMKKGTPRLYDCLKKIESIIR